MTSARVTPLILCGGSGTRLWPISRANRPKPFLPLIDGRSTFEMTLRRVRAETVETEDAPLFTRPVVVAGQAHRFQVRHALAEMGLEADVLIEPEARESGPALLAGALFIARRDGPQARVLALAADHVIADEAGFRRTVRQALPVADEGAIVTFGIRPTEPSPAYGYIRPGDTIDGTSGARTVAAFVEKPDPETARAYRDQGYLWNAGLFAARADVLRGAYQAFAPETLGAVEASVEASRADLDFRRLEPAAFARAERMAFDRAVMERTDRAAVIEAGFDWSDLGSWSGLYALMDKDGEGNALAVQTHAGQETGPAGLLAEAARRNMVLTQGPLVVLQGVEDLCVVASDDIVLVAPRDAAASRALLERAAAFDPALTRDHAQVFRPWGHYRSLDRGARHQVKRIVVRPGGALSLQHHDHRAEHWIVVRGTARVTIGERVEMRHENENAIIPIGEIHRLENPGKIDLEIIEVQTGSYFGEDDVTRHEDVYARG